MWHKCLTREKEGPSDLSELSSSLFVYTFGQWFCYAPRLKKMKQGFALLGGVDFLEPGECPIYKGPGNGSVAYLLTLDLSNARFRTNGLLQSLETFLVLNTV